LTERLVKDNASKMKMQVFLEIFNKINFHLAFLCVGG